MKKLLLIVFLLPAVAFAGPSAQDDLTQRHEVTPIPMITVIPTAIPTAYSTPQFTNTDALRSVTVDNGFDQDVWCAFNGSTSTHFRVRAGTAYFKNWAENQQKYSGGVSCIRPSSTPASGTLVIYGDK
jgi:hypothetical protein